MRRLLTLVGLLALSSFGCDSEGELGLPGADAMVSDAADGRDAGGSPADAADAPDARLEDAGASDATTRDGGPVDADTADAAADGGVPNHPPVILPPGGRVDTPSFSTSEACASCHSNSAGSTAMRDGAGREIGANDLWASSMKANAARDPFFRAVLSAEILATPAAAAAIEAKCFTCHAPMAKREAAAAGEAFGLAELYAPSERSSLGIDGVSCTVCHQIADQDLGAATTFDGDWVLSTTRQIFGPHDGLFSMPMVRNSGFTPARGDHIMESALCGSCHTLHTATLDAAGAATGARLPEQTPYLEWRNSSFNTEVPNPAPEAESCQGCHMPTSDQEGLPISTAIARQPGGGDFPPVRPRAPYGRHVLVGGNTLVPAMIRDHAAELRPKASTAAFDATIARARAQLSQRTANLSVVEVAVAAPGLAVTFAVDNRTGHKLPTAYPSRRMWLRVWVEDAQGQTIYEVGGFDARGRLLGAAGAVLPSELAGGPLLGHVDRVDTPATPQVWQSVMGDVNGAPTFTLLRGATYAKDNRLLPRGWSPNHPDAADTAPVGTTGDASFVAGGDRVTVMVPTPATAGHVVKAELLYQVITPRWVAELAAHDTPEVAAFLRYWAAADVRPERLASTEAALP